MWKLTIEDDQGNRIPVPLVRDDYSIGRGPENTLRLTERNVSRKHATLRRDNGRWVLVDLDSYNGSYVNGERVPGQQELSHGDLIQLGDYRIEIVEDATAAALVPEQQEEVVPAPEVEENGFALDEGAEDPMAEAMENAAAWPHQEPPARASGGKKAGVIVGVIGALAIGGAVFAFSGSGSKSGPEPTGPTAAVAPAPSPQPVERAPEPAPTPMPAEPEVAPVAEPAPEPALEVAEAVDVPEAPPKREEAPEPSKRETSPPPPVPVRVASAPTDEKRQPRTTQASAPAAPKPTTKGERRPVLAANPFDDPAPKTKSASNTAKPPSQPSSTKSGGSLAELAAQGREGEAKMRPILEQRVARGTASDADIRLLRAICRNMGDRVCADRMTALLAKKN